MAREPSPQELETIKEWCLKYQQSEQHYQDFFDAGEKNYLMYKSYLESSEDVYKHSIFVPYSFAYLEDSTAYYMLSITASPKIHAIEPRMDAVTFELCRDIETLVHWALTEENTEFILEFEDMLKSIGIFNVGYLINYPVLEDRVFTSNVFKYYHIDTPHPHDIYPEPKVKRLSRANWAVKKSKEDWDVLKKLEKAGDYKNVDMAKGAIATTDDPISKMLSSIGMGSAQDYSYDAVTNKIELLDCMFEGDVITIAGRRAIIQDTTEGEVKSSTFDFPLLDCRLTGSLGEWFGLGIIEQIKPLNIELNLLRSQRRDNVSLLLNKVFTLDLLAGEVDLTSLFSAPGNIIVGKNIKDALSELEFSDVTASSYKEGEDLKFDMQNVTSMWDYARGGTPRRRETATGIMRLQQAAQGRNEWMLRKMDAYVLTPLATRIIIGLREHLPREDYIAIIGPDNRADEFYAMSPEDLKRMLKIQPMTESIISIKEVELNQLIQAFDRLIQLPEINRPALVKQLLLRLGQKNIKEILPQMSGASQDATVQGVQELAAQQQPPGMGVETPQM
jgi:hypothetical protein